MGGGPGGSSGGASGGGQRSNGGSVPAQGGQAGGQEQPNGNVQPGNGVGGGPQGDQPNVEAGSNGGAGTGDFKADDPNISSAAQAADLVLKRLDQDLERGQVDQKLLDELGWSQEELKAFSQRMQQQLDTLKEQQDSAAADQLQRRRVEELLKSLDIKSDAKKRIGRTERDREQQDTATRRSTPPPKYKDWAEIFQRSLSEGQKRRKP